MTTRIRRNGSRGRSTTRLLLATAPLACVLALFGGPSSVTGAAPIGQPREALEVHPGEAVPGEALDEGFIEDMAAVIARDRAKQLKPREEQAARFGTGGVWTVPTRKSTYYPASGDHYATNKWGDTRMGIGFPSLVNVRGAFVAGQAGEGVWAEAVRVIGYHDGQEIGRTGWLDTIAARPVWLEMNLVGVDRIVFEAVPSPVGGGWYGIDDLTFTYIDPASKQALETIVINFEDLDYRTTLTGSGYAGLIWEEGSGEALSGDAVHAPAAPPSEEQEDGRDGDPPAAPSRGLGTPPDLIGSFQTVKRGDAGEYSYPPDTCGAAGPGHFCAIVNRNFAVYTKSGSQLMNVSLSSFMPGVSGDPRIVYDQHSDRWIAIATDFNSGERIYINISLTNNPMGSWYKTSFQTDLGSDAGRWPDHPTLGVNADGIYTAAYMVGGGKMTTWAIDKAPLIADPPSLGTVTAFRNLAWEGAIQPAHMYGNPGGQFFVSRNSTTKLRVRQLTGPMTSPTLATVGYVTVPYHVDPPDAPALGSSTPLDTVDARPINAVYRDGFIWTTHTISYGAKAAARWYKINAATTSLADYGTIADSTRYYFFPSIAVNADGDVIMGFTGSHAGQYATCYYTGRKADDPAGEMANPATYKSGTASQNNLDGYGRNRWGDYSLSTLDPADELTMWTIQEYGRTTDIWGTWVAELEFSTGPEGPENDWCEDATLVIDGSKPFTNVDADTDGPTEAGECGVLESDVWFKYAPQLTGEATVSLCGSNFDTVLAVYDNACPGGPGELIVCNDNACGDASEVTFPVTHGHLYYVRIGGYQGVQGDGTMVISSQEPPDCLWDVQDEPDGAVGIEDLVAVINNWGACADPGNCPWDCQDEPDGTVGIEDLVAIINNWGPCP